MGGGRISTLAVLLLGPPTARLVVRALNPAPAPGHRASGRPWPRARCWASSCSFAPSVSVVPRRGAVLAGSVCASARARWPCGQRPDHPRGRWGLPRAVGACGCCRALAGAQRARASTTRPWAPPAPAVWGLAPGGPTSVRVGRDPAAGAGAGGGRRRRGSSCAPWSWLAAAVGCWPRPPGWIRRWPGCGRTVVGDALAGRVPAAGGAILALIVAARGARGPGRPANSLFAGWVLCIGVLAVGWWVAPTTMGVGSATGIPPVVGLDAQSPSRPRSLVLDRVEGQLRYAVAGGPQALLGDAEALAGSAVDPRFADAVAGLVSGASGQVERRAGWPGDPVRRVRWPAGGPGGRPSWTPRSACASWPAHRSSRCGWWPAIRCGLS